MHSIQSLLHSLDPGYEHVVFQWADFAGSQSSCATDAWRAGSLEDVGGLGLCGCFGCSASFCLFPHTDQSKMYQKHTPCKVIHWNLVHGNPSQSFYFGPKPRHEACRFKGLFAPVLRLLYLTEVQDVLFDSTIAPQARTKKQFQHVSARTPLNTTSFPGHQHWRWELSHFTCVSAACCKVAGRFAVI